MNKKPVVITIDDDPIFGKSLVLILNRLGFAAFGVEKPEEFLSLVRSRSPNLLLIDLKIGLTTKEGFDLIESVRKEFGSKIPIIIISGTEDEPEITHALEIGADDYLCKPLDRKLLATKLGKFVQSPEIHDQKSQEESIPPGKVNAKIAFSCTIIEVNEFGILLRSAHLIPKGTVIRLSSQALSEITSTVSDYLLTVIQSSLDHTTGQYEATAEFGETHPALVDYVRNWLSQKQSQG